MKRVRPGGFVFHGVCVLGKLGSQPCERRSGEMKPKVGR